MVNRGFDLENVQSFRFFIKKNLLAFGFEFHGSQLLISNYILEGWIRTI